MTTMLDKITAAMVANDSGPEGSFLFDIHSPEFSVGYRESLLSALSAMRDVPDAILEIGLRAECGAGDNMVIAWQRAARVEMIDAIIAGKDAPDDIFEIDQEGSLLCGHEPMPDDLVDLPTFNSWFNGLCPHTVEGLSKRSLASGAWHEIRRTMQARITSDAAVIAAKDAEIEGLRIVRDALRHQCFEDQPRIVELQAEVEKKDKAVKRKDKALRAAIEALEEYNECATYLNPIRAALNTGESDG